MATFVTVWAGQVVSMIGTSMTGFGLGTRVYQETGSATRFALLALAASLPGILLSPAAGALVDRFDRRWAMIAGDTGAGCTTLILALLLWQDRLELWHIYLLLAAGSSFSALQWPAFSAATTLLVPKRHFGRASGLAQLGSTGATLLAPLLAGSLLGVIGLRGLVLIDITSFLFAVLTLLCVRFPRPAVSAEGVAARGSLGREALTGWFFIRERPGLLALLLLFAATHLSVGMVQVLLAPLVLSHASEAVLGRVMAVAGAGMVAGSLAMSAWGGPRRRVVGILGWVAFQGLVLILGGLRSDPAWIAAAAFLFLFAVPVIAGSSQAIWQAKVAPDLQGRVFAVRRIVSWSTLPLGYALAGPLADRVFEPLLEPGGPLADSVGRLLGTGDGRGIGLLFMTLGAVVLLTAALGFRNRRLRGLEVALPDAVPDRDGAVPSSAALQ